MRNPNRRRLSIAALVTVAAVSSAAPAQASVSDVCDTRLDRLEAQFYDMADRRGYEQASDWWESRWSAYHRSCVLN